MMTAAALIISNPLIAGLDLQQGSPRIWVEPAISYAIVQPLAPATDVPATKGTAAVTLRGIRVKVIDSSPGGLPRSAVDLLAPVSSEIQEFDTNARYIALTCNSGGGKLRIPTLYSTHSTWTEYAIPSGKTKAAALLAAFATRERELPKTTGAQGLASSLFACFVGATEEQMARLRSFLIVSRFPGYREADDVGRLPNSYSNRLAAIAQRQPPMVKAYIYQVLNSWRIFGADYELYSTYVACASDPNAFREAEPFFPMFVTTKDNPNLPKDFKIPKGTDANTWARAMTESKNPKIRALLSQEVFRKPDPSWEVKLAALLEDADPVVRANLCNHFAHYRNQRDRLISSEPHELERAPAALDEAVRHWKSESLKWVKAP